MTDKQKQFCLEYVESGNATAAAKAAGYSERTAYSQGQRMLKNVEIQNFIHELSEAEETQKIATSQEVLEFFTGIMRDVEANTKDRIRAADCLAKRYALYKFEPEPIKVGHVIPENIASLSLKELRELAGIEIPDNNENHPGIYESYNCDE